MSGDTEFQKFIEDMSEEDKRKYNAPVFVYWALLVIGNAAESGNSTYAKRIFICTAAGAGIVAALCVVAGRINEPNAMLSVIGGGLIGFFVYPLFLILCGAVILPFMVRPFLDFRKQKAESERAAKEAERNEREKSERDAAFWASPEGQRVRAAEMLAQIEAEKDDRRLVSAAEAAKLRLAEQAKALEMARQVADEEEARKEREFDRLKEL